MKALRVLCTFALIISLCACNQPSETTEKRLNELQSRVEALKPGLGEVMGIAQQHHAKLYYAGDASNWELAGYELDELKEGLEGIALYPHFKNVKVPLDQLVKIMDQSLKEVEAAIRHRDVSSFKRGFTSLTKSCNSCHQAADRGFVVIQTPKIGEFSNQRFTR